ncbi:haloalkane dehalogenase family protein [Aspergillus undulatus]|uniref:haloalkane dehalogenase family protein n=1 Tax=Aspergillus undulatus TaxID=1810928 RepID=UPI003CCD83AE
MPLHLNLNIDTDRACKMAGRVVDSVSTTVLTITAYLTSFFLSFTINRVFVTAILLPLYFFKLALSTIPHILKNSLNLLTPTGRSRLTKSSEQYRSHSDTLAQSQLDGTYRFKPAEIFHIDKNSRGWMASSAPWSADTSEFTVCGASVRYVHLRASYSSVLTDGKKTHRPIVFLHGNPSWSYLWRNVFPSLLERGHDIYAVDWIGHGRSDKILRPEAITFELHVRTLVEFFKQTGLENVIVAGHDWGGCIALCTIPRLPNGTVDSLFLLNSFFPPRLSDNNLHYRLLNRIWYCATGLLKGYLPISVALRFLAPHLSEADINTYTAPYNDLPRSSKASIERFSRIVPSLPRFVLFTLRQTKIWRILEGLLGPEIFDTLNTQARLSAQDDQVRSYWSNKADEVGASAEVAIVFGVNDPLTRDYKSLLVRTVHPERMVKWAPRGLWIPGAGHLVMEVKPGEVAGLIARFARGEQPSKK